MKKAQKLKTLGDYRQAVKDPNFEDSLFPKGKNASCNDALKIALDHSRQLLKFSHANKPEKDLWDGWPDCGTHQALLNCIVLMEFALTYKKVHSTDDFFSDWPKSPDVAAFDFVRKDGFAIVTHLQNAYRKHRKTGPGIFSVITFLNKTPALDDLQIKPEPNIIIKTWLSKMIKNIQEKGVFSLHNRGKIQFPEYAA